VRKHGRFLFCGLRLLVPILLNSFSLAHDAVPCIRRERDTLSHRVDARDRPVMESAWDQTRSRRCPVLLSSNSRRIHELGHRRSQIRIVFKSEQRGRTGCDPLWPNVAGRYRAVSARWPQLRPPNWGRLREQGPPAEAWLIAKAFASRRWRPTRCGTYRSAQ
jgi:hypothetical protein